MPDMAQAEVPEREGDDEEVAEPDAAHARVSG